MDPLLRTVALAAAATALALPRVSLAQVVLPNRFATTEANFLTPKPVGPNSGLHQIGVHRNELTAVGGPFSELAFRLEGGLDRGMLGRRFPSLVVRMGHTPFDPPSLTTNFAANRASTMTGVFRGPWDLPTLPPSRSVPSRFDVRIPFLQPFQFAPTNGHLLVEWEVPAARNRFEQFYPLDAVRNAGAAEVETFGTGGVLSNADPYALQSGTANLRPGGSLSLVVRELSRPWPVAIALGSSNRSYNGLSLPFDLTNIGAPGNALHVAPQVLAAPTMTPILGQWFATLSMSIPNLPGLTGAELFAQAVFQDPAANPLGVVSSPGLRLRLAGRPDGSIQMLFHPDPTRPTGTFVFGDAAGGPIMRLR